MEERRGRERQSEEGENSEEIIRRWDGRGEGKVKSRERGQMEKEEGRRKKRGGESRVR